MLWLGRKNRHGFVLPKSVVRKERPSRVLTSQPRLLHTISPPSLAKDSTPRRAGCPNKISILFLNNQTPHGEHEHCRSTRHASATKSIWRPSWDASPCDSAILSFHPFLSCTFNFDPSPTDTTPCLTPDITLKSSCVPNVATLLW